MKTYQIAALAGDGIGPEIMACALDVLNAAAKKFGFDVKITEGLLGGCAIDSVGDPYPEQTRSLCERSDAVLLGSVGGPKWDHGGPRPEQGLLGIRAGLGLFANLRPTTVWPSLKAASPLKDSVLGDGLSIMIIRELTGGIYFGDSGRDERKGQPGAYDVEYYTRDEVRRIARVGFETALKRKKKLTSVDKANVLESSRFWRENVMEVAKDYPGVELSHLYVDNASMQLVRDPKQFDVIVTNNIFGDILSDEAAMLTGSIGLLPSASLGEGSLGLFEPVHGSAPDIAGQGVANPLAMILSAAMMLTYSLNEPGAAGAIEAAVQKALENGARTPDLGGGLGTKDMAGRVIAYL